ncbi:hypothetical protein BGX26_001542 [Mortierella sp. AD094]|nr:hypothetical protein BGX26_001542 [Mortierella sp. AD094]
MSNTDYAARAPSLDTHNPVSDVPPHTRRHSLPSGKSLVFRRFFKTSAKQHQRTHSKPAPLDIIETSVSPSLIPYSPSPSSPSFSPPSSTPASLHNIEDSSRTSQESTSSDKEYPPSESSSNGSLDRLKRSFTWKAKHRRVGADSHTPVISHTTAYEAKLKSPEKVAISSDTRVKSSPMPSNELPQKKPTKLQRWQSKSATKFKSWLNLPHSNHSHAIHQTPPTTTPPTTTTSTTTTATTTASITTTTTTQLHIHHNHRTFEIQEPKCIEVQAPPTPSEEASKESLTEQNTPIESSPTSNQLHLTNIGRFRSVQKYRLNHYRRRSERYTTRDGLPIRIPKRSSSLPKSFSPRNGALFDKQSVSIMAPETFTQDDTSSELQVDHQEQQSHIEILEEVAEDMDDSSEDEAIGSLVTPTESHNLETLSFAASFPLPCSNPASPTSGKPETLFSVTQPVTFGDQSEYSNVVEQTLEEQSMVCLEPTTTSNDRDQTIQAEQSMAPALDSCTEEILDLTEQTEHHIEDVEQAEHSEELMQQIEQKLSQMEWEIQTDSQALVAEESPLCTQQPFTEEIDKQELPEELQSQPCQHELESQPHPANFNNDTNLDFNDDTRCDEMGAVYSDSSSESDAFNNSAFLCEPVEVFEKAIASDSAPTTHRNSIDTTAVPSELQQVLTCSPLMLLSEPVLDEPLSTCNIPVIPKPYRGLVIETLMEMYPSTTMRWRHQPRPSYPGQVNCRRAGCTLPINVEKETGIRHPFCSIACARACGENPRERTPAKLEVCALPAYEAKGYTVPLNRVSSISTASSGDTCYASPPATDDSPHHSDAEDIKN